jgi:hypothetical protein
MTLRSRSAAVVVAVHAVAQSPTSENRLPSPDQQGLVENVVVEIVGTVGARTEEVERSVAVEKLVAELRVRLGRRQIRDLKRLRLVLDLIGSSEFSQVSIN